MFFIPFPFSEIICFVSMFFTWICLVVGIFANIHTKQPVGMLENAPTISKENIVQINSIAFQRSATFWKDSKQILEESKYSANISIGLPNVFSCCYKELLTIFKFAFQPPNDVCVFVNRGPPSHIS